MVQCTLMIEQHNWRVLLITPLGESCFSPLINCPATPGKYRNPFQSISLTGPPAWTCWIWRLPSSPEKLNNIQRGMFSYVCDFKGQGNGCRSSGAGVTGKQRRMAEHLLKCSPAHVKRWEAKPERKSLACKMSLQRSVIKQTFDMVLHVMRASKHVFFNVQYTSLTCIFVSHIWTKMILFLLLQQKERKKNINKKIKATKQMESEVAELLIITSTTYFIIKSFFWLQAAGNITQIPARWAKAK